MGMAIRMNVAQFKEQLRATVDDLHAATRPAAQAGAQIIYDAAKVNASTLRSDREHYFYGTATKALPPGKKKAAAYGPFQPGSLYNSIYQVFAKSKSFKDVSTYHISFNREKAPYGFMVELGTSHSAAHPFIGKAVIETRSKVREAIKARYIAEVNK
jgi:HK97 gp10 family phage protein